VKVGLLVSLFGVGACEEEVALSGAFCDVESLFLDARDAAFAGLLGSILTRTNVSSTSFVIPAHFLSPWYHTDAGALSLHPQLHITKEALSGPNTLCVRPTTMLAFGTSSFASPSFCFEFDSGGMVDALSKDLIALTMA
jgi:hypothetical protein